MEITITNVTVEPEEAAVLLQELQKPNEPFPVQLLIEMAKKYQKTAHSPFMGQK